MPERRPDRGTWALYGLALLATAGVGVWQGREVLVETLQASALLLVQVAPLVLVALLVGGYVQALLPRETVAQWLGPASGARGYGLGILAGALTPAGPFAAFPIALGLLRAGAGVNIVVAYLTAWATLGLQRVLIWEIPLLGPELTALRLAVSLPLPVLAGWLAGRTYHWVRQ